MRDTSHLDTAEERASAIVVARSTAVLTNLQNTAIRLEAVIDVLPLETPEAEAEARKLLQVLETLDRDADKARVEEKAPHLAAGNGVDAKFREPRKQLARITDKLRRRVEERALAREAAQRAAREAAVAAARKGDVEGVNAALAAPALAVVAAPSGVSESFSWDVESIVLALVPAEFLMVDLTKVKAYVKDCDRAGKTPEIKGVRFKRSASLRVGSV